jgi:PPOX class probable F420-dependent enzyme
MTEAEMRRRVGEARVARLGTVDAGTGVHLVPCVFALSGDLVYMAVDDKPKRHRRLRRLGNLAADDRVCLLIDAYDEDWSRLWWVRLDGRARILEGGEPLDEAIMLLAAKYPQYRGREASLGPAVAVDVSRWSGWSASAG